MADKAFFDELNRRMAQGSQLARQQRYLDARTAFYSCLEHADEQHIVVPIGLILDVWTNIIFCLIDAGQPENAAPYLDAMDAIIAEWEAMPDKNNPPGKSPSYALMKPLMPENLIFDIRDNFDSAQWKQRIAYYRKQLATELKTVDDVLQTLWDFAAFHCGETRHNGDDVNWYVVKDSLMSFDRGQHDSYVGGMLYLRRNPAIAIGAAITADGCWVTMMSEFYLEEIKRKVWKSEMEQVVANDKRALRAFLESLISKNILVVSGDRFRVNLPQS
ncbi:MAG: hypothetical protein K8I30_14770 [Anaerolineae bacterium]|nr:hypothetical protein [Anaerolineae bacterium]